MVRAGKDQRYADGGNILAIGRTYMRDAERCEMESDYIAAEGIYRICGEMFSGLIQQKTSCEAEARGEYMHVLFRYAMLPQVQDAEKLQYLNQAFELASRLEKETGDMEYTVAAGCIGEEMDELNKNLQKQMEMEADQEQAAIF